MGKRRRTMCERRKPNCTRAGSRRGTSEQDTIPKRHCLHQKMNGEYPFNFPYSPMPEGLQSSPKELPSLAMFGCCSTSWQSQSSTRW